MTDQEISVQTKQLEKSLKKSTAKIFFTWFALSCLAAKLLAAFFSVPNFMAYYLDYHFLIMQNAYFFNNFAAFCFGIMVLICSSPLIFWKYLKIDQTKVKTLHQLYAKQDLSASFKKSLSLSIYFAPISNKQFILLKVATLIFVGFITAIFINILFFETLTRKLKGLLKLDLFLMREFGFIGGIFYYSFILMVIIFFIVFSCRTKSKD